MHKWDKSIQQERHKHHPKNPSFSSTLNDIHRSIVTVRGEQDLSFYGDIHGAKQHGLGEIGEEEKMSSLRRACLTEKWMGNKLISRRQQQSHMIEEIERRKVHDDRFDHHHHYEAVIPFSTASSSSDSSFGGFSSSETESSSSLKPTSSCLQPPRPKPVRTSVSSQATKSSNTQYCGDKESSISQVGTRNRGDSTSEDGSFKSKSRALKIYSNLTRLKQPVSPGMRLASFINSLFAKESSKKKSRSSNSIEEEPNYYTEQTSTCSSASSFSRSCLMSRNASNNNYPASGSEPQNGIKRSVRFYPVSVIVDEDSRPCGHKSLNNEDNKSPASATATATAPAATTRKLARALSKRYDGLRNLDAINKHKDLEDIALELLNGYWIGKDNDGHVTKGSEGIKDDFEDDNDNDDIDGWSCSSSDLFELDHLSLIGDEELPVYETTHFTNDQSSHKNSSIL